MKHSASVHPITFNAFTKIVTLTIGIQICSLFTDAQQLNIYNSQSIRTANFLVAEKKSPKRFWRAAGEWAMVQAIPWAYDMYIRKADFAKISIKSIDSNFQLSSWKWDDNTFSDNQFAHPFHGSLFFNTFRSNGYSFWESIPAVVMGTYTWETLMEKNVPAPNDIINTTLGGIVMGEMNNRIVKLVMRKISNKQKRKWDTDSLRVNTNPCSENLIASIATESGWRQIISNYNKTKITSRQGMYARVNLQYGDPFTACKVPFDNFSMVTEIGHSDTAKLNSIQIEGCIYGKIIHQTEIAKHVVSISMNYDYFQNDHFVYGAQSIKMNLLSRINFSKNVQLELHAGTGIIALAAVHNTHMYYGEGRNYDYCSGISLHVGARLNVFSKLYLNLNSNMQETITVNGYTGSHLLQNTAVDLRIVLGKGFSIVAATSSCVFNGYYKNYADVTERYVLRNVGVGYKIKI